MDAFMCIFDSCLTSKDLGDQRDLLDQSRRAKLPPRLAMVRDSLTLFVLSPADTAGG